jgi:glycosyltransferase involved in cell wall biosynthesis
MSKTPGLITIFTPSHADAANTNAQQLTVKEVVARLPPERFRVAMFCGEQPDPRIAARPNTLLIPAHPHGNTRRFLTHLLAERPEIYFFPRTGPLDRAVFNLRKFVGLRTALVTYIVMAMDSVTGSGMVGRSIREGDVVVSNSKHVSETIRLTFGVESSPIYDGIDRRYYFPSPARLGNDRLDKDRPEEDRAEKDRAEDAVPVVLHAGSFQPRKRVELIIQQALRHPHVRFRLAGRGETEPGCRALAQQLGCHNVEFIGHLTSAELGNEMRKSDLFLFPSILEGHPQVLGQASACGLPSIAMNLYRPDYVLNGESGFLVESDAELAEKLQLLLRDPDLRRSMSRAAAVHAQQFDWDRIVLQWQEVFEAVTAKR